MIVESIFNLLKLVITSIFSILPNIPNIGAELQSSIITSLDVIFSNLSLLGVFIRPSTIIMIIPVAIAIHNFKHIYDFINWIYNKIPFI